MKVYGRYNPCKVCICTLNWLIILMNLEIMQRYIADGWRNRIISSENRLPNVGSKLWAEGTTLGYPSSTKE